MSGESTWGTNINADRHEAPISRQQTMPSMQVCIFVIVVAGGAAALAGKNVTSSDESKPAVNASVHLLMSSEQILYPGQGRNYPCEYQLSASFLQHYRRTFLSQFSSQQGTRSESEMIFIAASLSRQLYEMDAEFDRLATTYHQDCSSTCGSGVRAVCCLELRALMLRRMVGSMRKHAVQSCDMLKALQASSTDSPSCTIEVNAPYLEGDISRLLYCESQCDTPYTSEPVCYRKYGY